MKRCIFLLSVLLIATSFSACTLTTSVETALPVHTAEATLSVQYVNQALNLRVYPQSAVVEQEERGRKSTTRFRSSAGLDTVYAHFHSQLRAAGWSRTKLEQNNRSDKVEARYERGRESLKLELNRQGNSGYYKLVLKD